jgi:hypothetical protein
VAREESKYYPRHHASPTPVLVSHFFHIYLLHPHKVIVYSLLKISQLPNKLVTQNIIIHTTSKLNVAPT